MKVIVIGGGPAGMMAAISAKQNKHEVILIEKMRTVGRKLSITGKGRCNITNMVPMEEFFKNIPNNDKFLYSAFQHYTNEDLIRDLNQWGLATKVERGGRVFPVSDNALEVVHVLQKELDRLQVKTLVNQRVKAILVREGKVIGVKTEKESYEADVVILATGGKSYPLMGSTGDGYTFAKTLGHTIITPRASLVPIETFEQNEMQGLSLKNVSLVVKDGEKKIYEDFGEMLFTHFGLSGPIVLSASSHVSHIKNIEEKLKAKQITFHIDLKPALSEEKLDQRLLRDFETYSRKQCKNCLHDLLPAKMIPYVMKLWKVNPEKQIDQVSKEERKQLIHILKDMTFTMRAFRPIEEAIITSGGVSVKEVNPSTMESKLIKGLYFAGEVLDVDAYTGGFNLQIAFSTGHLAGNLSKNVE